VASWLSAGLEVGARAPYICSNVWTCPALDRLFRNKTDQFRVE
jgi:hypothetical protein